MSCRHASESLHLKSLHLTHNSPILTLNQEHEANYEKLEIMLEEIEADARRFGHKAPSFLARKMKSLREAWKNIPNMTDFSAEPSHKDWYRWLDHQLDYITHSYSDCHDKEILSKLKIFLDKFKVSYQYLFLLWIQKVFLPIVLEQK